MVFDGINQFSYIDSEIQTKNDETGTEVSVKAPRFSPVYWPKIRCVLTLLDEEDKTISKDDSVLIKLHK